MRAIVYCVVHKGEVKAGIEPAWSLDKLYMNMAKFACGEPIPSGYASHAVAEKLLTEGYEIATLNANC